MREKTIVELPRDLPDVSAIRGTLIAASVGVIRDRGLSDAYYERLPEAHHAAIREVIPQSWVPVEHALAHYAVMDSLVPGLAEHVRLGRGTADRVQRSYLHTITRALKSTGAVTPLTLFARVDRIWARTFQGGAAGVWQTGPKDVRVECHGVPLVRYAYFRDGWQGAFHGAVELVARKAYVHQVPRKRTATTVAYQVSWV